MKTPTHNPTPGTLHAPCTYASMQSVLVKIASPAQTPAPCDQPTARVRARVDLCLDLLAKVLRSATVRSAILREENRVSHGLPARVVASCTVPAADVRGREEEENRSISRACAEVCALRAARCTLRSEEQDCLRHGLRAASGAVRAAIVPQHMPGLDAASCNLRAAACDWPTARGLRLADCGSRVCSQTKQLCRHHAHMPGIDSASCNLRRAPCGRPTTRGLRLAERRLATRKRVERRHSTADCKLHVAARRMRPSGTKLNGLLRTFSDS